MTVQRLFPVALAVAALLTNPLASADRLAAGEEHAAEQSTSRKATQGSLEAQRAEIGANNRHLQDAQRSPAVPPPQWLTFVPEMQPIPEVSPARGERPVEQQGFAAELRWVAAEWKKRIPEVQREVTPQRVRSLSRWAKKQMEPYRAVPALERAQLGIVGVNPPKELLILEGTIDTLPTHSPLVTRWLKVFLLADMRQKTILRVFITIRGERLE